MSKITVHRVNITTTGEAGSATGQADTPAVNGFYLGAYLNFHASAPATTDTTIAGINPTIGNIQVLTDTNSDAYYSSTIAAKTAAGAAVTNGFVHQPVSGNVRVSLAQCDALTDALVADLYFLE